MKKFKMFSLGIKSRKSFPIIVNICKRFYVKNNNLILKTLCLTKGIRINDFDIKNLNIIINEKEYHPEFSFEKGIPFIRKYRINKMKLNIPIEDFSDIDIQNKILVKYDEYTGRVIYNVFDLKKGKYRNSNIIFLNNMSIYLRQTIKNTMYLTVRETNKYDYLKNKIKVFIGYILSKMYFKKDIILLYEKECSRYEESASMLYERLIDKNYNNSYYIINKDNPILNAIDNKYKKNIIYKDSLKHIIYFFKCKKFLATESLDHGLQLRIANRHVFKKLRSKDISYVFLQHGVMYMISLDSDLRTAFRKQDCKLHKIIVSSKLEAKHFTDLGGFDINDLYICGLPKFDKAVRNNNSDKIVIMPTWRRWEINLASTDYEKTKYFKMIKRIINGIPKNLQDKIIMLPHPLMLQVIKNNEKYKKYIPDGEFTYDEILKKCSLLITDYSSISYDAFYRGSNVIFYWEEKEECLKKYGENTKLMLNEKNAFGPTVYNKKELSNIIIDFYLTEQKKEYIKKYKKIVEFSDNKNTERLIEMLKKDNVL